MRCVFIYILVFSILSSCGGKKKAPEKKDDSALSLTYESALNLTIEKNLKFRHFSNKCDGSINNYVKSDVFILPINKELIDAVIDLKAYKEELSKIKMDSLRKRNYATFLNSGRIVFIQIVINNKLRPDEIVYFNDFANNISLQIENGSSVNLSDFTPSLAANLNPGFNAGYLYFNTRIPDTINSYSINFSNISLQCNNNEENTFKWAFAFDRSELNFFSLLEKGMNSDEIRKKYVIASLKDSGIGEEDVIQIIIFLFKTFSKF